MVTPIRPSLAQMLQSPTAATPQPAQATQSQTTNTGFAGAMAAQKAFFQNVTGQTATAATATRVTPATYTAADIARATPTSTTPSAADTAGPPKRPGSFLNIVV